MSYMPPEGVTAVVLTTETFWEKLCDFRCVRTGLRRCVIGRTLYATSKAPEEVPGFVAARVEESIKLLSFADRPWWLRWLP